MESTSHSPIIISGPQGCGKTRHAQQLAAHYGKSQVIDDWKPGMAIPADAIALTNLRIEGAISFFDAAKVAGIEVPEQQPKFCKDCRYFGKATFRFAECSEPSVQKIDLINGPQPRSCQELRAESGACGKEGRLFASARKPYKRRHSSSINRSSVSNNKRVSTQSSEKIDATTDGSTSDPKTETAIDLAVTSRS